ncbi:hypothetical protein RRG08_033275 [Elysia crispata]|uniref:Uncharacterized protein n=1 Tax=Elysia crispata TaxID=231223 RepID=A0AAE1CKL2_9GAST|nr:hypothetical protein RRG08_033275 [Elysia crispata]
MLTYLCEPQLDILDCWSLERCSRWHCRPCDVKEIGWIGRYVPPTPIPSLACAHELLWGEDRNKSRPTSSTFPLHHRATATGSLGSGYSAHKNPATGEIRWSEYRTGTLKEHRTGTHQI